ncbi:transmembrane protease serine 9-like [Atheta coriaria]|uniref:transmembrane protease serine 9-like n=1 Tax=Dalotia coriaria TaxID=877792 RepID=UPI0031F45D6D
MKFAIVLACIAATAFAAPGHNGSWRIVGGDDAEENQFPYQVSLRYFGAHSCGGSILDETTILCAAHCVDGADVSTMAIRVGNNKLSEQTDEYQVASFVRHEDYDGWDIKNDVAIIKLADPLTWSDSVQPVKLRQSDIIEEDVTLSGWGTTSYPGDIPDNLQFINLKTISVDDCSRLQPSHVGPTEVCTFTQKGEGACHGDSGGPLVDSNGEQIGIVSWGTPCAQGYPDVFTRVYSFLDWIEENRKSITMKVVIVLACVAATVFAAPGNNGSWRIVGGAEAAAGTSPHQVSIRINGAHTCSGSILDDSTILTTAHCVVGSDPASIKIAAGKNKLSEQVDEYRVKSFICHEDYDSWDIKNDIAIIKLTFPILLTPPAIQAVELRQRDIIAEEVTVYGPTEVCTFTKKGEGVCHGDAGGPLVDSDGRLVGIVSWHISSAPGHNGSWRIVGGDDAAENQFPYQVSLRYYGSHSCGGSLLDETTILCAAHCVDGADASTMTIRVGNNKLSEQTDEYQVASFVRHEDYDGWNIKNDVSLIKLADPLTWSDSVQPVKLRKSDIIAEDVTLSGWGTTSYPGDIPDNLQFINLKTISVDDCSRLQPNNVGPTEVCTFTQKGEGACHGDSGGPLVDSNGEQIGIVSWGVPCAEGYPDVFTRVYSFLDWIESNRN